MSKDHEFLLGVTHISRDPGVVENFVFAGVMKGLEVTGSRVDQGQEIVISGIAEAVHGGIMLTGEVRTVWMGECRRCLGQASGTVVSTFRELFERAGQSVDVSEAENYLYTGEVIDLRELVKDQVILGLPWAPLCREGCRGLCPLCGANLNDESCGCSQRRVDPRWSALDVLVDKDR